MDKTQTTLPVAHLFVIAALAVSAWAMVFKTGVATSDEAGILLQLPEQVAAWSGVEILFCSERSCGGQYMAQRVEDLTCPRCEAPLDTMTWAERAMLPADTGLTRRYYVRPNNQDPIQTSIVLSGDDRSSIHRPQVCMTAAGHEIMNQRVIRIPLETREEPLEVMVLDMSRPYSLEDGSKASYDSFYAYWFVGKNRETPSHIARMVYMGYDRIRYGVSHRWAYIAMAGGRDPGTEHHLQTVADFASQLHPALLQPD